MRSSVWAILIQVVLNQPTSRAEHVSSSQWAIILESCTVSIVHRNHEMLDEQQSIKTRRAAEYTKYTLLFLA